MTKLISILALSGCLLGPAGCKDEQPNSRAETHDQTETHDQAAGREFEQARRSFVASARHRMAQLDEKIADLRARGAAESEEARGRLDRAIDDLKDERADIERRLDRAETESKDGWDRFKTDVSRGIDDLERAYNGLLDRMKTS